MTDAYAGPNLNNLILDFLYKELSVHHRVIRFDDAIGSAVFVSGLR